MDTEREATECISGSTGAGSAAVLNLCLTLIEKKSGMMSGVEENDFFFHTQVIKGPKLSWW